MDNTTVKELISLRTKGLLTEPELLEKLSRLTNGTADINYTTIKKPTTVKRQYIHRQQQRTHMPWTQQEDERLVALRQANMTWSAIAKDLCRTKAAIKSRAKTAITTPTAHVANFKRWEKTEDDYIKMMYAKMPVVELVKALNRTEAAVRCRAKFLKVRRHPRRDGTVAVGEIRVPQKFSLTP